MKIEVQNKTIEFDVHYGKRKKISIHIDCLGLITVKVPKNTSEEIIKNAVEQKSQWILEKLNEISQARQVPKPREYQHQGKFLHLGKEYFLHELIEVENLSEEELKKNLKKFYTNSCRKVVAERIKIYQQQLGVKPKLVEVVESKTQWGSCNSDKKITINYRLIMAPLEILDYVIIHELCHLIHMNHDRSFWRKVGSIVQDYKKMQEFLAMKGHYMTL